MNNPKYSIQLSMPLTPWAQLVTPILVARCDARRVRPIATEFFKRWPTVNDFKRGFDAGPELFLIHVHGLLVPLGLAAVRTSAVANVAMFLVRHVGEVPTRSDILAIPGCGRYVADSFDLFYHGNLD